MRTREKKLTTTVHRYVEADDKNSDAHYKNSNGQNFPAEHQNSTAEHQGRLRLLLLVLPMRDTTQNVMKSKCSVLMSQLYILCAKLRKNERNAKGKAIFLLHFRVPVTSAQPKLRKKVVVTKRFWKINAIRPKIKAIKGKTRKFNLGQKANWGGLVKELGFLFDSMTAKELNIIDNNEYQQWLQQ